mmetsp:Transcript_37486/g.120492  ORF Transcript_37486/g.120492 Transcript_37486/m.120492 type:complete len:220 (+) Transcript_37486:1625-2284(+)
MLQNSASRHDADGRARRPICVAPANLLNLRGRDAPEGANLEQSPGEGGRLDQEAEVRPRPPRADQEVRQPRQRLGQGRVARPAQQPSAGCAGGEGDAGGRCGAVQSASLAEGVPHPETEEGQGREGGCGAAGGDRLVFLHVWVERDDQLTRQHDGEGGVVEQRRHGVGTEGGVAGCHRKHSRVWGQLNVGGAAAEGEQGRGGQGRQHGKLVQQPEVLPC